MNSVPGNAPNETQIKQHKIYTNILFNAKQVSFLSETGQFKIYTYQDLLSFIQKENLFTIAKLDMGQKLKDSLETLGFNIYNSTTGIAEHKHSVGVKYVILVSEDITTSEYLDILPQNRSDEMWYENRFDSVGNTPNFIEETDMTFTYTKSNYINQTRNGNMSLKGINKELSSTETTTDAGSVSVGDSVAASSVSTTVNTGTSVATNQSGY